jgi:hypothetical protein
VGRRRTVRAPGELDVNPVQTACKVRPGGASAGYIMEAIIATHDVSTFNDSGLVASVRGGPI